MPPAPPRRPRRWSWSCTAVVVQVVGVFALAAMVAMPERHLRASDLHRWIGHPDTEEEADARRAQLLAANAYGKFLMLDGDPASFAAHPSSRLYCVWRSPRDTLQEWRDHLDDDAYLRRVRILGHPEGRYDWYFREAGPHALLNGFSEWLTQ